MELQGVETAKVFDSDLTSLSISAASDIQGAGRDMKGDSRNQFSTDFSRASRASSQMIIGHVDMPILTDPLLEKGLLSEETDDVHDQLKGAAFADSKNFHDETYSLYKASSVPHLHSKSSKLITSSGLQPRKKTSEASALPDSMLLSRLREENQSLQSKLKKQEEEKKEIVGINHAWDMHYQKICKKYSALEEECRVLREELGNKENDISSKEQTITRLTKKVELLILNSTGEADKGLWKAMDETAEHNEDNTLKRTEVILAEEREGRIIAQQQARDFKVKCEYLEGLLSQQTQQRVYLQNELKRLSTTVNIDDKSGKETPGNDIDLLKQQLEVYAEDFNAEKHEKQRLLQENEQLKKKVKSFTEEKDTLIRQLQIYEEDFQCEREKRINLMRRTICPDDELTSRAHPKPPPLAQDPQRKWKEYCCLVVEKEQILDRINELESQGITRYNGRSPTYQQPGRLNRAANVDGTRYHDDHGIGQNERNDWPPSIYGIGRAPSESDSRRSNRR